MGIPHLGDQVLGLIAQGKICGYCGEDIRTDYGLKPDDTPYAKYENLGRGPGRGTGLGEPSLCAGCQAAGKDPNYYMGWYTPEE